MRSPNKNSSIPYRPYIDGLRGVAVIAVVLYHAKLFFTTGGFIGVDIFFVISGFLITLIITRDLNAGTFSLLGFWERRVRRILPAHFVVMLASVIAAYFLILYPPDYVFFGKTVIAQSMFVSNALFMVTDNYFDEQARFSPLLHTWSLSVEEQFYILFPFVVLFSTWLSRRSPASRMKRYWAWVDKGKNSALIHETHSDNDVGRRGYYSLFTFVILFGILSLLLNIWFVDITPNIPFKLKFVPDRIFGGATYATIGFYLLFTRMWELALGILVALCAVRIRSPFLADVVSISGIIAIGTSIFIFTDKTSFPGIAALLPTMGAAAFIVANESHPTRTGRILSSTPLIFVGVISYSLYLWHWPLFVFAKLTSSTALSPMTMAGLCAVAVIISWLSYRFIELPFRKKTFIHQRYVIFLLGATAMGILVLSGMLIKQHSSPFSNRIPLPARHVLETSSENIPWGGMCFQTPGDESRYGGICRIGDAQKGTKQKFVLWGDSHAEAMAPLFNTLGRAYGVQGVVFDGGNCIPIIGAHLIPPAPGCEEEKEFAIRYIRDNDITQVILIARWSYYLTGGQNAKRAALITDTNNSSNLSIEAEKVFERKFVPMVQQLSREGRSIYIVEQVPEQPQFDLRNIFYRAVHTKKEIQFESISMKDSEATQALPNSVIDSLASLPNVHIINPAKLLCKRGGLCELEAGGKLIYRDESHLSTIGAMSLEPLFTPFFKSIQSASSSTQ